jgi:hypothetical protein
MSVLPRRNEVGAYTAVNSPLPIRNNRRREQSSLGL